jgi:hypothetical protein
LDLTEPAIHPRFCDAIGKLSDDLAEALTLARVDSQHRAADAGLLVLAGAAVGPAAVTEFELARLKVPLHFVKPGLVTYRLVDLGARGCGWRGL